MNNMAGCTNKNILEPLLLRNTLWFARSQYVGWIQESPETTHTQGTRRGYRQIRQRNSHLCQPWYYVKSHEQTILYPCVIAFRLGATMYQLFF